MCVNNVIKIGLYIIENSELKVSNDKTIKSIQKVTDTSLGS